MEQKKKGDKTVGKIVKTAVSGVLCIALAGGIVAANVLIPPNASSVQSVLGLQSSGIDNSKAKTEGINMEYSKPGFDTLDALVEDEVALNKQIAAELGVSEITVKVHRRRVMEKMQVRSVAELVRVVERLSKSLPTE